MEQGLRFFLLVLILKDTYSILDHVQRCLLCLWRNTGVAVDSEPSSRRGHHSFVHHPRSLKWWRGRKQTRLGVTRARTQHASPGFLSSFLNTGSYSCPFSFVWWEMRLSLKASFESPNEKQVWSFFFFFSIEMVPESVYLHNACRPLTWASCWSCGRERLGFSTCRQVSSPGAMRAFV